MVSKDMQMTILCEKVWLQIHPKLHLSQKEETNQCDNKLYIVSQCLEEPYLNLKLLSYWQGVAFTFSFIHQFIATVAKLAWDSGFKCARWGMGWGSLRQQLEVEWRFWIHDYMSQKPNPKYKNSNTKLIIQNSEGIFIWGKSSNYWSFALCVSTVMVTSLCVSMQTNWLCDKKNYRA